MTTSFHLPGIFLVETHQEIVVMSYLHTQEFRNIGQQVSYEGRASSRVL